MKFTVSDCISRINQALNYPALSYIDVSHFFDQAIAELNTTLRIALPTVTEMISEHTFKVSDSENAIVLTTDPTSNPIIKVIESESELPEDGSDKIVYLVEPADLLYNTFYIFKEEWVPVKQAYGIVSGTGAAFETVVVSRSQAFWKSIPYEKVEEFSLTDYLTTDWIILFLIPYVCFKFSVRNGDNGALFSDEFTQGFQQLQTSYNVPNTVVLKDVAHVPVYKEQVLKNLANLHKSVTTRAITEDMRVPNGIRPIFGRGLFERGGWGV